MKLPEITHNKDIINDYVKFLELQEKKPKTVENRIWGLVPLLTFAGERDLKKLTKADIEQFLLSLKKSDKKPSSVYTYSLSTRTFFKWFSPNNDFFKDSKIRRVKIDHSKKEFVNIEDVKKMLQACRHQRDRAFLFTLWESAGRLEEVLQLNIGDVKPQKEGAVVTLRGKTGVRKVLLIDAVPDLLNWLNLCKGTKETPLFTVTGGTRLTHEGAQTFVNRIAKKANLEKHVYCHSFRHGRLTELSKLGVSEMELRIFAGWGRDSDMPSVYLHLDEQDIFSKLRKIKGLEPEEEILNTTDTKPLLCPSCSTENPFDAMACYKCRAVLDPKLAIEIEHAENEQRQAIEQLKKEIEELRKAQEKRDILRKEFAPVFEEGRKEVEEIERVTGMRYEDAIQEYDTGSIFSSEMLENHNKKLNKDKEYRKRWKQARSSNVEKQEAELGKKALKTLADSL